MQIKREISKPNAPRDERWRLLHPKLKVPLDELATSPEEHIEGLRMLEEKYAKNISLVALASGKLLLKLYKRIKNIEVRLNELESRISRLLNSYANNVSGS